MSKIGDHVEVDSSVTEYESCSVAVASLFDFPVDLCKVVKGYNIGVWTVRARGHTSMLSGTSISVAKLLQEQSHRTPS